MQVEIQEVEMAAYPTEGNPLEAEGVRGSVCVSDSFYSILFLLFLLFYSIPFWHAAVSPFFMEHTYS